MRKWVIAGTALLTIGAVVFLAVLNLNSLVTRNRAYLLARAEEALGRKITAGEIELSLWGGLGLRVEDFGIADDPAFSGGDFVRARDAKVHLRLMPLFRKQFEIKNIILHDPVITVVRNERGVFNFASLGKQEKKERPEKADRKPDDKRESGGFSVALADISNGEVIYRDQKDGGELNVKQIDLAVRDAGPDKPVSLELQAALFGEKRNLNLQGVVGPLQPQQNWRHIPVEGEITFDPLDLTRLQAAVPALRAVLPKELAATGLLSVRNVKFKGTADDAAFGGRLDGRAAAITFGRSFNKSSGIPMQIAAEGQYSKRILHIRKADLKLHGFEASTRGEINFAGATSVNLSLESRPSALSGLDQVFPDLAGYELAGTVKTLTTIRGTIGGGAVPDLGGEITVTGGSARVPQLTNPLTDLNGKLTFSGRRAAIQDLRLTVGTSKIDGSGTIESFSPLRLSYKLSAPEFRPADFQAVPAEARRTDILKNFAGDGKLALQGGRVNLEAKIGSSDGLLQQIPYQRLEATVALAGEILSIRALSIHALGGTIAADGEYSLDAKVPRFNVTSKLQRIDVNDSYRLLSAEPEREIRGRLNGNLRLTGAGRDWEQIKPTLRGQGDIEIIDGALLNVNLADAALSGAGIPGMKNLISAQVRRKYPETFEAKDTKFKEMKARLDIANQRVNVNDLRVAAADYYMTGEGWIDFDRRVEFRSVLMLSQRLSADLAQSAREVRFFFNERKEFQMPFTVSGRSPDLKTTPDSTYLARTLQRGLLGEGAERLERQLFGRKDKRQAQDEDVPPSDSGKRKKNNTEDLIRRGLEGIFKR